MGGNRSKRHRLWLGLTLLAVLIAGLVIAGRARQAAPVPTGLFTTLPILWNESADVAGLLKADQPPHWAKAGLRARGPIAALDVLAPEQLARVQQLVIAQPRPLGPTENVALDDWVRGGGHLLLLADPALTEESRFAIGDPRRPQAVVLLSPILTRWGLELRFDDVQPFGERAVTVAGVTVPTNLAGHWAAKSGQCVIEGEGLMARCTIGKGQVTALADAELLNADDPEGTRAAALPALLDRAFTAN